MKRLPWIALSLLAVGCGKEKYPEPAVVAVDTVKPPCKCDNHQHDCDCTGKHKGRPAAIRINTTVRPTVTASRPDLPAVLRPLAPAERAFEPPYFSPQLASDRSIVRGRVLTVIPDSVAGAHIVVVDTVGRPYKIFVTYTTGIGTVMQGGSRITAWCRGAGADLVADSVRVEER